MIGSGRRRTGPLILAVTIFLVEVGFTIWGLGAIHIVEIPQTFRGSEKPSHLPCWNLAGANDTLVVLRTGATELLDKLPAHLDTSARCFPNYVVYSDYEEYYHGQLIVDTLDSISQNIREEHPDFELYRRLKSDGRSALRDGAFRGGNAAVNGMGKPSGNSENPGWKLDKWKFLPMVNRTLYDFPDMKWYIFTEVDAYVSWSTMLQYLSTLDATQLVYAGQSMSVGADYFIYGGAGIIMSRSALQAVVAHYSSHKKDLEDVTDRHWAGDAVLGKAFKDAGVSLTNIWPMMQSDYPGWLTYLPLNGGSMEDGIAEAWCNPVATFHHVSPKAVRDLWYAEQEWTMIQTNASHLLVPSERLIANALVSIERRPYSTATGCVRSLYPTTDGTIT
ncbi:hypothetical protein LTR37_006311 [Vermiconidia calcicola]|uniref:Uncharacterized protein n=1 Tax=Vermiconidia calcicola TaxID=1690605 RepID=A0ACC3NIJ1_9PEZI|nr:hypothetical protein LTR37_006311 [Vermiconidia calcicola]